MPSRRRLAPLLALLLAPLLPLAAACRTGESAARGFPRERAHAPEARAFDVLSYAIRLELLPAERAIRGACRLALQPLERSLETVRLDLVGLTVEAVQDGDGRLLSYAQRGGELVIELAEPLLPGRRLELVVDYGGRPERGLWFSGRRADGSGPTMVFTHGQTEGSRGWFPCVDEPAERARVSLELWLPPEWVAVAPGARREQRSEGGRRVERWQLDFEYPSYLASLVAGELVVAEGRAGEVPLQFLCEPRFADWLPTTFAETDEVLAFLADYCARPYPFDKYSQAAVDNFPWGGMENISATTLTPQLLGDERALRDQPSFYLIAHEAAHQWFGDLFTCADWAHLWLNEGFASYMTLLYLEHSRGVDEFRAQVRETQEAYLLADVGAARRPLLWNRWKEPDDVFDARPYQGGAARLHLLRFLLGDEAFRAGVRLYVAENEGRGVVTDDLRRALERASGRDLGRFFEQWLSGPGFPEFVLAWDWQDGEVRLAVDQIQDPGDGTAAVFELPVEIELGDARGARSFRVELDERRERLRLPSPERPLYVRFDAHGWIPKRVAEEKEPREWLALAEHCQDVNARREAVLALGGLAARMNGLGRSAQAGPWRAALRKRLEADPSPWVRADAATALGLALGDEEEGALSRAALEDADVRVRAAALTALRAFAPSAALARVGEEAFLSGTSYAVMAAGVALQAHATPGRAFELLRAALAADSPHDVLAGRVLRHLAGLPDTRVPAELRARAADPALAPTARAVAVECLGGLGHERGENARWVARFLGEDSFHLRLASVRALAACGDPEARRALTAYYPRARTAEERRAIEAVFARALP